MKDEKYRTRKGAHDSYYFSYFLFQFLDKLLHFMEDHGTPISTCPTISKNPLDLFKLYFLVKERMGFLEVCKLRGFWRFLTFIERIIM